MQRRRHLAQRYGEQQDRVVLGRRFRQDAVLGAPLHGGRGEQTALARPQLRARLFRQPRFGRGLLAEADRRRRQLGATAIAQLRVGARGSDVERVPGTGRGKAPSRLTAVRRIELAHQAARGGEPGERQLLIDAPRHESPQRRVRRHIGDGQAAGEDRQQHCQQPQAQGHD